MPIKKQAMLQQDGLILRPWTLDDAEALDQTLVASRDFLLPWISWAQNPPSLENTRAMIEKHIIHWEDETDFVVGIFDAANNTILGGAGFHRLGVRITSDNAQIGLWIAADHARRGVGVRVLRMMLEWGFQGWGFEKLQWRCDTDNLASIRCAQKGGMEDQGVWSRQILPNGDIKDSHVFWLTNKTYLRSR